MLRKDQEERLDTLVDPVEMLSSSHLPVAPPVEGPRPTFASLDPDAQVQWFSRVFDEEPTTAVDVDIAWDEDGDTEPTLVLRRRVRM